MNKYLTPFRYKEFGEKVLITNEVGDFDFYEGDVIDNIINDELDENDIKKLEDQSIITDDNKIWRLSSLSRKVNKFKAAKDRKLSYLIVIPTLRCNLSCSYCQVSRAPEKASGFDWTEETLKKFKDFIYEYGQDYMKIEFQGGEPTLRIDIIKDIIEFCDSLFSGMQFVICSNMLNYNDEIKDIIKLDNVVISTSVDGNINEMTSNRTFDDDLSRRTFNNINSVIEDFGWEKISALPTITEEQQKDVKGLIDKYIALGFNSIFLRPVNYHGFARKSHKSIASSFDSWKHFYTEALEYILEKSEESYFEEFYLKNLLQRIVKSQSGSFVDYRSPANYTKHYMVIDFDGSFYPTDESRMLSRTKQIDLCVGTLADGFDESKISQLNINASHHFHPDCQHCVYLPYCGIDLIDDLSRYGRVDSIKKNTWYCERHTFLFDFIFTKISSNDLRWINLFNKWLTKSMHPNLSSELFHD